MSKASLKKELASMTKAQLEQMVMEAYSARKEIKDYFEYFLSPDPDKLYDKAVAEMAKETSRGKWGRCKARISVLRKIISNFAAYQPGEGYVQSLREELLGQLLAASSRARMSDTLLRGAALIIKEYLAEADRLGNYSEALTALGNLASNKTSGTTSFRRHLHECIVAAMEAR